MLLKRDMIRNTKNLFIDIEGSLEAIKDPEHFSNKWALKYELFRRARTTILIDTNCTKVWRGYGFTVNCEVVLSILLRIVRVH